MCLRAYAHSALDDGDGKGGGGGEGEGNEKKKKKEEEEKEGSSNRKPPLSLLARRLRPHGLISRSLLRTLSQYEDSCPKASSSGTSIGAGHELFSKFCTRQKIQQQYICIK